MDLRVRLEDKPDSSSVCEPQDPAVLWQASHNPPLYIVNLARNHLLPTRPTPLTCLASEDMINRIF